jgi:hypothetical protein
VGTFKQSTWTPQIDQQLVDMHAAGLTLTACAKGLGRSKTAVSRRAKTLGLTWDRAQTKAATAAVVADNKSRRAAIEAGLLDDVQRLRAQMFAPCKAFNFGGKDNTYNEVALDQPVFADQLRIMQAATTAVDRSLKIAVHDSDSGAGPAKSLLSELMKGLRIAYEEPKDPVPSVEE